MNKATSHTSRPAIGGRAASLTISKQIRALLVANPDGIPLPEIASALHKTTEAVRESLRAMPDCYIDRWESRKGWPCPVWCRAEIPEDCPMPEPKRNRRKATA